MALRRGFNWKDDDYTDSLNRFSLGLLPYGVYAGFDGDLSIAGMNLNLTHTVTGASEVTDALVFVPNLGVVRTKQGGVFYEETPIVLPITPNASGFPRIDLVILRHEYIRTTGGANGTYLVIEGIPSATPVEPALVFPNKETIIGALYVPDGTADLSTTAGVLWSRRPTPMVGNDATIVRTFGTQRVSGFKQFDFTGGTELEMTLNITDKKLVATGDSDTYSLLLPTTSLWVQIDTIEGITNQPSHVFKLTTSQRLKLTNLGNMLCYTTSNDELYVEAGETITFINIAGWSVVPSTPAYYMVFKGGTASLNMNNKFFATQRFNKGGNNFGVTVGGTGYFSSGYDSKGNFYDLRIDTNATLDFIPLGVPQGFLHIFGQPQEMAGLFLFLHIKTSTAGGTCLLRNNVATPPTNNKPIQTPTGADMVLKDGDMVLMIEDVDYWRVISITGATSNFTSVYAAITALSAAATNEVWKNIGAGGNMDNGQPVPAFISGVANDTLTGAAPLRLRKLAGGYVHLSGRIKITSFYAFHPVITMPTGYKAVKSNGRMQNGYGVTAGDFFPIYVLFDLATSTILVETGVALTASGVQDLIVDIDLLFDTV